MLLWFFLEQKKHFEICLDLFCLKARAAWFSDAVCSWWMFKWRFLLALSEVIGVVSSWQDFHCKSQSPFSWSWKSGTIEKISSWSESESCFLSVPESFKQKVLLCSNTKIISSSALRVLKTILPLHSVLHNKCFLWRGSVLCCSQGKESQLTTTSLQWKAGWHWFFQI